MSKQLKQLFLNLLWLGGLAGLAVVVILMLRNTRPPRPAQAPEPTPVPLSTATPTASVPAVRFDSPIATPTPAVTETSEATPPSPPIETPLPPPTRPVPPTPLPGDEPIRIQDAPTGEAILYATYRRVAAEMVIGTTHMAPLGSGQAPVAPIPISFPVDFEPIVYSTSPDGRYVLLLELNFPGGIPSIFDRQTNEVKPLFDDYPWVGGISFDWSVDSKKIVFWAIGVGLWLIDVETTEETLLTVPPGSVQRASISPSGQQVAFIAARERPHEALWVVEASGGDPQWVLDIHGPTINPGWSTEGILYFGRALDEVQAMDKTKGKPPDVGMLWATDTEGKERRSFDAPFVFGLSFEPRLSPDRRQLAFTGLAADEVYDCREAEELRACLAPFMSIYILDLPSGQTTNLGQGINPAWSPDGKRLAFVSYRTGTSEVWLMNTDGTGLRQLTHDGLSKENAFWLKARE